MRANSGCVLIGLIAVCGCASAGSSSDGPPAGVVSTAAATQDPRPGLVGVWRVLGYCDQDSTGRISYPYGPHPVGYLVYTPTGQLSAQIMRTPPVPPFASGEDLRPTDAELRTLHQSYFGYFGTYTITSDSTVIHRVEGGTLPSLIGTAQPRRYRIRGDTLSIGSRSAGCRLLLRVG